MQAQTLVLAPSSPVQGEVLGELSVFLRDNGFESGWDAEIRAELSRPVNTPPVGVALAAS